MAVQSVIAIVIAVMAFIAMIIFVLNAYFYYNAYSGSCASVGRISSGWMVFLNFLGAIVSLVILILAIILVARSGRKKTQQVLTTDKTTVVYSQPGQQGQPVVTEMLPMGNNCQPCVQPTTTIIAAGNPQPAPVAVIPGSGLSASMDFA